MARNRQRAKDRKQRQSRDNDLGLPDAEAGSPGFPPLAGGAPPDDLGTAPPPVDFDEEPDDDEEPDLGPGAGDVAAPVATKKGGVSRIVPFIKACWAELQRVQWPDRKQVGQATAVVLGFVVMAGAFLGLADIVAQRIVDFIL